MVFGQGKRTIDRYRLLAEGDRLIVGASAGVDSMVLLHLLNKCLPWSIWSFPHRCSCQSWFSTRGVRERSRTGSEGVSEAPPAVWADSNFAEGLRRPIGRWTAQPEARVSKQVYLSPRAPDTIGASIPCPLFTCHVDPHSGPACRDGVHPLHRRCAERCDKPSGDTGYRLGVRGRLGGL